AAGSLTTGTYDAVTSTYDSKIGLWSANGSVDDVNQALAAVTFRPSSNWNEHATITTRIRDAANTGPDDGTISLSANPVNDPPTAILLSGTSVAHSDGTDAIVGTLKASDVDDESHFYVLLDGVGG